jgi:hypothetical protein
MAADAVDEGLAPTGRGSELRQGERASGSGPLPVRCRTVSGRNLD